MNNKSEKLKRLLEHREYIDYLLKENEELPGDSEGIRSQIRKVVNNCILNGLDYAAVDPGEIKVLDHILNSEVVEIEEGVTIARSKRLDMTDLFKNDKGDVK